MSERRVILLVLGSLEGGGAERVAVNLLRHCDSWRIDLRVGLLRREGDFLAHLRPRQLVEPTGGGRGWLSAVRGPFAVAAMVAEARPELVMSFGLGPNLAVRAALAAQARRRPFWICREDSNPWEEIRNHAGGPLARAPLAVARRMTWRDADLVLTVADDLAAALAGQAPRIRSIHNPIDVEAIETAAVEPLPCPPGRLFVVAAGRLVRQKGFDLLIDAFARSRHTQGLDLVILGDGPLRADLSRQARELGVPLILPGFQANPWSWFASARLFVLPSRWEGFGNVVAEAMACGAPVLVSDCDFGPREQVAHGESGWVTTADPAALAAAMDTLLGDSALCARLAVAGRARARKFAAPLIAEAYTRLFTGVPLSDAGPVSAPAAHPAPALS